ncbi:MAG: LlaJI family restriction endonuclease [Berryella intestinalis]|uniref:LlaJI family restriction endonuclease n=1 Tax=Berryella intestinalis TaxID=1531429 RepID=UPI002A749EE2|nr:LlaJI family restriction endonuclease [Berryella intestinalis]MDY3129325.1 LlaJI family restriction endonuclease [Berryella intestinalis]
MGAGYCLIRELKPYSLAEVANNFGCKQEQAYEVLKQLLAHGVVRYRTGTEQDDSEIADGAEASGEQRYQFRYVGIVIVKRFVIVCYPKYIRRESGPTEEELCQMVRVLRRLDRLDDLATPQEDGKRDNVLSTMVRLLELYDEYGVYSNFERTHKLNGDGVIDWERTVNTVLPVISSEQPIYIDYWTRKTERDESDLVTRLHRAILTECSRFLTRCGIAGLLELGNIELTSVAPVDLGDVAALDWNLERERATQFVTWKQEAIDLMRLYLGNGGVAAGADQVLCMGTTAYYHSWELACKVAFGDLLDKELEDLPLELVGKWRGRSHEKLLQIIPHPIWEQADGNDFGNTDTLIPDTVTFVQDKGSPVFCIYDAKYYVPYISANGKLTRQPGLESVTKQFLYQSAYKDFIEQHNFHAVINAFLVPTDDDKASKIARVTFSEVMGKVNHPFSNHIDMWSLPAIKVFDAYLRAVRVDLLSMDMI